MIIIGATRLVVDELDDLLDELLDPLFVALEVFLGEVDLDHVVFYDQHVLDSGLQVLFS